eukprot:11439236-Alexandrium_andersonii.AAC.1
MPDQLVMHQSAVENEFNDKKKEPEPPPEPGERDGVHDTLNGLNEDHLAEKVEAKHFEQESVGNPIMSEGSRAD